jgi:hypothetical protein
LPSSKSLEDRRKKEEAENIFTIIDRESQEGFIKF